MDDPEWILKLVKKSFLFQEMYREIYEMCQNLEGMMQMYSKELRELDSNTVQYMIDEMQETINQKDTQLAEQAAQLGKQEKELKAQATQLSQKESLIAELQSQILEMKKHLSY